MSVSTATIQLDPEPKDVVFIDTETTGLDATRHEIIEVAAIRVTHDLARVVLGPLVLRVRPTRIEDADPRALDLNGYSAESWEPACDVGTALDWLQPLVRDAVVAGHNVGFDVAFLEAAARATGRTLPWDYHRLDTATLAWLLTQSGSTSSVSLQPVCDALGIVRARAHRALDDARASLDVARRIRGRWAFSAEFHRTALAARDRNERRARALDQAAPESVDHGGDA